MTQERFGIPETPKLRPVEPVWVQHQGQRFLHLRDTLGLSERVVLIPQNLAPLLALCDGTRDMGALRAGLALRTGIQLTDTQIRQFITNLDEALVLENGSYQRESTEALKRYREAPHRRPSRSTAVYPSDPDTLKAVLDGYIANAPDSDTSLPSSATLVGVVSPHIDYERGGESYAQLWRRCTPHLHEIELVIVFGTDHSGSPGAITPTRQSYATPFGTLPTDSKIVDGLAEALGSESAYAEELHHVNEHSIELALVWFHHAVEGRSIPTVPVLCGSFQHFVTGEEDLEANEAINDVLVYLREATADRRTLVIAAADLAHVGPAFGDLLPVNALGRPGLAAQDARSIAAICDGDADAFFALSRSEADARNICGLPPIYLTLRFLDGAKGESIGYAQCPADATGGSLVSIVGALLFEA